MSDWKEWLSKHEKELVDANLGSKFTEAMFHGLLNKKLSKANAQHGGPAYPPPSVREATNHIFDSADDLTGGHVAHLGLWLDEKIREIDACVREHYENKKR